MQQTSDEVLIQRIAGGDRLAMQVLFARHHVRVYRFVLRLVRNESTAEDLISEVFLDVWRQAGRFEGRSAVSTWLLAIARFKALSALRGRKEAELDDEVAEAIEDVSDTPEVAMQKKDTSVVPAQVHRNAYAGTSGDHRSGLLPREVRGRSRGDRRDPGEYRQDAHVLCAEKVGGVLKGGGNRERLAMNTTMNNAPEREEIESLLPWYAAGTLSRRDTARVEDALANDTELARRFEMVREELGETIGVNESLGAPSARAMKALFEKIDAEPARKPAVSFNLMGRVSEFMSSFTPRTLAYAGGVAVLALVLQAGVIRQAGQRAHRRPGRPVWLRAPTTVAGHRRASQALVRFAPQASAAEITAFLERPTSHPSSAAPADGNFRVLVPGKGERFRDREEAVREQGGKLRCSRDQ